MAGRKKKTDEDAAPKKPKAKPNVDAARKASYVKRWAAEIREFNAAKEDHKDRIADLTAEIKSGADEHGIDPKEVQRLAKIDVDEQKHRDQRDTLDADLTEWDKIRAFDKSLEEDDV